MPVNGPPVLQQLAVILSIRNIISFSSCYSQGEKLRGEEAFISSFIMARIWEQSKSLLNTGMDTKMKYIQMMGQQLRGENTLYIAT